METWPELPYAAWKDTRETLHMWLQIAGKVKLELSPYLNEWWEVALHLTTRGLTTGLIPWHGESFSIDFDFVDHQLKINLSDGQSRTLPLEPRSVADFYRLFMETVASLGIEVKINTMPSEVQNGIRFEVDTQHASYDGEYVQRWWRIMLGTERVIQQYRTPFHGKSSPIQFFWGGFDLNHARFNGKPAPPPSYGGRIMEFGEDEENFSIGFWPGTDQLPQAAFYSYITPAPKNLARAQIQPVAASFNSAMGEFIFLYDEARKEASPEKAIEAFFQSTYEASAELAGWSRQALEGHFPALRSHASKGEPK